MDISKTVYVQIAKKVGESGEGVEFSPIYLFHLIISLLLVLFDNTISKYIIMGYNSSHNFITIKKEEENADLSQLTWLL